MPRISKCIYCQKDFTNKCGRLKFCSPKCSSDSKIKDRVGQRIGSVVIVSYGGKRGSYIVWNAICDCGKEMLVQSGTTAKGCISCSKKIPNAKSYSVEYRTRANIIQRCTNAENPLFKYYGGRGIGVCERWRNSFEAFLEDMGPKPGRGYDIDRIDNYRGYEPGNCRWVKHKINCRNRRETIHVLFRGEKIPFADIEEIVGIKQQQLYDLAKRNGHQKTAEILESLTPSN